MTRSVVKSIRNFTFTSHGKATSEDKIKADPQSKLNLKKVGLCSPSKSEDSNNFFRVVFSEIKTVNGKNKKIE